VLGFECKNGKTIFQPLAVSNQILVQIGNLMVIRRTENGNFIDFFKSGQTRSIDSSVGRGGSIRPL